MNIKSTFVNFLSCLTRRLKKFNRLPLNNRKQKQNDKLNKPKKKKNIKAFFCIFLTATVVISMVCFKQVSYAVCGYTLKSLPIYSVARDDKKIAISFDCAWGNEYTAQLLQIMDEYGVKCTFFAVSFWAEKYPNDVKEIVNRGHEMGTHSKTHSYMSKQSEKVIAEELDYSVAAIQSICGQNVTLFRPPYGDYNNRLIDCVYKKGLYPIQWDVDSLDWKNLSATQISMRVISKVKSGSIILCHNNGLHTAESLLLIFADLQAKGYKFVKISELIYKENYKMTADGTQVLND